MQNKSFINAFNFKNLFFLGDVQLGLVLVVYD